MNPIKRLAEAALRPELAVITENQRGLVETVRHFQESIAQLELALEDVGYQRMKFNSSQEFSRGGLDIIIDLSRMMAIKNPLVRRAVELERLYVFAQGVSIAAEDEDVDAAVQEYLTDPRNQCELTKQTAMCEKNDELKNTGNLFLVHFPDPNTGTVVTRSITVEEIRDIVSNPQDSKEPWYYLRTWTETDYSSGQAVPKQRSEYYRDWRYPEETNSFGGKPVFKGAVIQHVKVGGNSSMRFGAPEEYSTFDWALAVKKYLENLATFADSLTRFAWTAKVPGGQAGADSLKAKLNSTLSMGQSTSTWETNPPPTTGATAILGGGNELDPISVGGKGLDPEGARALLHMVCAGSGFVEFMYGNADVGNHATSTTLDRPTWLKMRARQLLWDTDIFTPLLEFVIERSLTAPAGLLAPFRAGVAVNGVTPMVDDPETGEPKSRRINVEFPPILEDDPVKTMDAIVSGATLNGQQIGKHMDPITVTRKILSAWNVADVDEIMDSIFPGGEVPDDFYPDPVDPAAVPGQPKPSNESRLVGAVQALAVAVKERNNGHA